MTSLTALLNQIAGCTLCSAHLPLGPRPVLQVHPQARILLAAQAPGRKVHQAGRPFADASGERLREWLGVTPDIFYDPRRIAILPMGFCFPGKGASGDKPPRRECAPAWREKLLPYLSEVQLTLVIGRYAQAWHLPEPAVSVTAAVANWREYWPAVVPLPHPSPRNNPWLKRNPWFERDLLPVLRARVAELVAV